MRAHTKGTNLVDTLMAVHLTIIIFTENWVRHTILFGLFKFGQYNFKCRHHDNRIQKGVLTVNPP